MKYLPVYSFYLLCFAPAVLSPEPVRSCPPSSAVRL